MSDASGLRKLWLRRMVTCEGDLRKLPRSIPFGEGGGCPQVNGKSQGQNLEHRGPPGAQPGTRRECPGSTRFLEKQDRNCAVRYAQRFSLGGLFLYRAFCSNVAAGGVNPSEYRRLVFTRYAKGRGQRLALLRGTGVRKRVR